MQDTLHDDLLIHLLESFVGAKNILDELQEKYAMTKRHRIEVFGEVLNRAKEELNKRDLSEMSTDKLVKMVIMLSDNIRKDETELILQGDVELPVFELGELKTWKI